MSEHEKNRYLALAILPLLAFVALFYILRGGGWWACQRLAHSTCHAHSLLNCHWLQVHSWSDVRARPSKHFHWAIGNVRIEVWVASPWQRRLTCAFAVEVSLAVPISTSLFVLRGHFIARPPVSKLLLIYKARLSIHWPIWQLSPVKAAVMLFIHKFICKQLRHKLIHHSILIDWFEKTIFKY